MTRVTRNQGPHPKDPDERVSPQGLDASFDIAKLPRAHTSPFPIVSRPKTLTFGSDYIDDVDGDVEGAFTDVSFEDVGLFRLLDSPSTLKGLLTRPVLKVIGLHEAFCGAHTEPQSHVDKLHALGSEEFILQLLPPIAESLGLHLQPVITLEQLIQLAEQHCHLRECPQYERPNVDNSDLSLWVSLCELQCYKSLQADYRSWPREDFDSYALIFASQAFGRLHYMLPAKMNLDEVSNILTVLTLLCRDKYIHDGAGNHILSISAKSPANDRYDLPKTPSLYECGDEIVKTSLLERSVTGIPADEEGGHTTDDLISCGRAHTRVATCAKLTSLCLKSRRERLDAVRWDDDGPAALLQACHLLFRAERSAERHDRRGAEACIKCILDTAVEKCPRYRVEWAVSRTEFLLSVCPLPSHTLSERMCCCERSLKVTDFTLLQPYLSVESWFLCVNRIISILQLDPRFRLEEEDLAVVTCSHQAKCLYAVACLIILKFSPPEDLTHRLLQVFNKILWESERQSRQGRQKVTDPVANG
ncbi:hypothetical protein FALBO_3020 [Fusarium albosuccineum]|uniref:Uncharacterized protein n=1 Tax=Fusarium albosuccineum TaxID=1237068 RepID=A0A8H4LKI9_9HYPO|nr:hypothetical protein FALBO_3020 [Fusarium albosuccineum]